MTVRLAVRLALRDWRGGNGALRGMGIVLLCLALGVAAIGAIGGLRDAIQQGVAEQRRAILGGDLVIESSDPLPAGLPAFLHARGDRTSSVVRMRSMVYGGNGRRMLVELSAVDAAYPLVGAGRRSHPAASPRRWRGSRPAAGVRRWWPDPLVLHRLGPPAGRPRSVIGSASMVPPARRRSTREPDRGRAGLAIWRRRVLIARLGARRRQASLRPGALAHQRRLRVAAAGRRPPTRAPRPGWRGRGRWRPGSTMPSRPAAGASADIHARGARPESGGRPGRRCS